MCNLCGDLMRVIPLEVLGCGHAFHTDCLRARRKLIKYTCATCDAWDFHEEVGVFGAYNPHADNPDVFAAAQAKYRRPGQILQSTLTLPEYIEMLKAKRDPSPGVPIHNTKNKKSPIGRFDSSDRMIKNEFDIFDVPLDWNFPWFITLVIVIYILIMQQN